MSLERIAAQADEAEAIARRFGVTVRRAAKGPKAAASAQSPTATNPARQVALLGEMAQAMQGPVTLDQLLQLALTGVVEGAGFDRVFFALLSPDRSQVLVKHNRGNFPGLPGQLPLEINEQLAQALTAPGPSIFTKPWTLLGNSTWQSAAQSLLLPVFAGRTGIGLLYADRYQSGPDIPPDSVAGLVLFMQQVTLGLAAPAGN